MTSEVEERPRLITADYGRHGSQWVNGKTVYVTCVVNLLLASSLVHWAFPEVLDPCLEINRSEFQFDLHIVCPCRRCQEIQRTLQMLKDWNFVEGTGPQKFTVWCMQSMTSL